MFFLFLLFLFLLSCSYILRSILSLLQILFLSAAIEKLSTVTKLAPHLNDPYQMMAMIYEENGDKLGALQFYVLAASYTKKTPTVWMDVYERAKDLRELNQALAAVDHAIIQMERLQLDDFTTQVPDIVTAYMHSLSTHPINTPYQPALSTTLSTHPINLPYQQVRKLCLLAEMDKSNLIRKNFARVGKKNPKLMTALVDVGHAFELEGLQDCAIGNYVRYAFKIMGNRGLPDHFINFGRKKDWIVDWLILEETQHRGMIMESVDDLPRLYFAVQHGADMMWDKVGIELFVVEIHL